VFVDRLGLVRLLLAASALRVAGLGLLLGAGGRRGGGRLAGAGRVGRPLRYRLVVARLVVRLAAGALAVEDRLDHAEVLRLSEPRAVGALLGREREAARGVAVHLPAGDHG